MKMTKRRTLIVVSLLLLIVLIPTLGSAIVSFFKTLPSTLIVKPYGFELFTDETETTIVNTLDFGDFDIADMNKAVVLMPVKLGDPPVTQYYTLKNLGSVNYTITWKVTHTNGTVWLVDDIEPTNMYYYRSVVDGATLRFAIGALLPSLGYWKTNQTVILEPNATIQLYFELTLSFTTGNNPSDIPLDLIVEFLAQPTTV